MTAMSDVFNIVWGQPKVREYFRNALSRGAVSHAYLLCGPAGCSKTSAARALAASLLCESGGCGECETCKRVLRNAHPDVHVYAPEGLRAYVVDQVRAIINDVPLAPIQAQSKVYIVQRADLLNAASANAFLKTLEEPPTGVTLILLARSADAVLPTIVSRCTVVPFRTVSRDEAEGLVCQNAGVGRDRARISLAACDSSVEAACVFAKSNDRIECVYEVYEKMLSLRTCTSWDIVKMSTSFVQSTKASLDAERITMEEYIRQNKDFLSASAIKQLEKNNKRSINALELQNIQQLLCLIKTWLHDLMVICVNCEHMVLNERSIDKLSREAAYTSSHRVARAIQMVQQTNNMIAYNVSPQTCIDALLFDIRKVLYDQNSSGIATV